MERPNVTPLFDTPYIRMVDLQYAPGTHYYNASRRALDDLVAVKTEDEFQAMLPDAVSCVIIFAAPGEEPKLLLANEFRRPIGRYLVGVTAGLIDELDKETDNAIISAAIREIKEETGLSIGDMDSVTIVNPVLFSTPGMTDESNALVCAVLRSAKAEDLSQDGAEETEQFDGFCLLSRAQAMEMLKSGEDPYGRYYPLHTWAALMYFVSDMWQS